MTREEAEKRVPKTYEEAMRDKVLADFISPISLWCRLIELGFIKDFDEVNDYQKKVYEQVIRKQLIDKLVGEQ